MNPLIERIVSLLPLLATTLGVVLFLLCVNWALLGRYPELGSERRMPRQFLMLGLTIAGVVLAVLALPVSDSTRNQVIGLIGVLLSGIIAFGSTTIVANVMAGIMLRITRPFRIGDLIRVSDHFGRVVERGILDTEIQTEQRELISLPNTYLITHPIGVVRSSGAIISATLSLGYDVHHAQAESLLVTAARTAGLNDPFVQIIELGDHAITYRVSGLLPDVKCTLSARSNLHRKVLDTLHGNGVEIVSPGFVNQRRLADQVRILPAHTAEASTARSTDPEQIVFDKADQAERREQEKQRLQDEIRKIEDDSRSADGDNKPRLAALLVEKRNQLAELESAAQPPAPTPAHGSDACSVILS